MIFVMELSPRTPCESGCVPVTKSLIDMYGKCGALKRTHGLFDEMGERDLIDDMPVGNVENVCLCRDKGIQRVLFFL